MGQVVGAVVVVGGGAEVGRSGRMMGCVDGVGVGGEDDGGVLGSEVEEDEGGRGGAVTVVEWVVATVKV